MKPTPLLPMPGLIARRYELIVGWDCEWLEGKGSAPNRLLSYQLAWKRTRGSMDEGQVFWHAPADGHRPVLADLLALLPHEKRVLFVAHNGLAELAHLRERPRVIAIGKVPITFNWERTSSGQLVQFRDTMLLAAEGAKALAVLSETNAHYKKIDLQAMVEAEAPALAEELRALGCKAVSRMDLLLSKAPSLYKRYAMHDSLATLEYFLRFQSAAENDYGVDKPAVTAVGLSQAAFIARRPEYKELWGATAVTEPDEWGKTRTKATLSPGRAASEALATACYKGGLNTAYHYGWAGGDGHGSVLDVDMVGAYASSMATLRRIDWDSHQPTLSAKALLAAVEGGAYGYAHCSFSFPAKCKPRQTTLGDRLGSAGLIYCRQGTCYATGDELLTARAMGASIELHRGVYYATSDELPFANYLAEVDARRVKAKAAKDKHGDLLAKLVGNGLYGKLGQGLGSRHTSRVMDDDEAAPIRHSSLTSPQYASYCTARVRCALATLVNCAQDLGATPLSATTDGAMIAMPDGLGFDALLRAYEATPFGALMAKGREALGGGPSLVLKASGAKALTCRTRVNALFAADGTAIGGAWTGWRGKEKNDALRASEMATTFTRSDKALTQRQSRLPNPHRIYAKGEEYRPVRTQTTLRVDYDHKRFLARDGSTSTWTCADDFSQCRKLADKLRAVCTGCGHGKARHFDKKTKRLGPCNGTGGTGKRAKPCPCKRFHGYAATATTLAKWPRAVPLESPKSAVAAGEGAGIDAGAAARATKAPKPRAAKPLAPRTGRVRGKK